MNVRRFFIPVVTSLVATVFLLTSLVEPSAGQGIQVVDKVIVSGTIVDIKPGELSIKQDNGDVDVYKIQDKDERAVSVGGTPIRIPARISVEGTIPANLVERGMIVHFFGRANVYGKCEGEISTLTVLSKDASNQLQVEFLERPDSPRDFGRCEVTGRVIILGGSKLQLQVAKAKWARQERIFFKIADDCVLKISDDDLGHIQPSDLVTRAVVLKFSTGEKVIQSISLQLSAERKQITTSFNDELENRFSHLSDQPGDPRELRSDHFVLYTDVSDRSANILLAKLETMYGLVSGYYSARPTRPIECYVVRDLRKWPLDRLTPSAIAKIRQGAAVTRTVTINGATHSTVYSSDKHSIVQHEAVHAFCAQTFGSTGPVWYAEGMAELGQYWKPDQRAVNIDAIVITYLTNSPPKQLTEIVAAGQITGDSWQAYAWRWALCHLLSSNPNYAKRFKTLGLNLMSKRPDSFELAFEKHAEQIAFEYDQFIENFNNGYRVDLCTWNWKTRPAKLSTTARLKHKIKAKRGWQATKLRVQEGVSYDIVTQGTWTIDGGNEPITADGNASGNGKLIGVILNDFQLGEPFELGVKNTFIAPDKGQLYVRCRDRWTGLADNDGLITLFIRRTPKKNAEE